MLDVVEIEDHDGEKIVEVVRDPAGHLPERFHLMRLAQVLFRLPALRHIGDADDEAVGSMRAVA